MKIALICPAFLPASQFGGILFLFYDLARESSNSGHDVTVFTTDLDFANNLHTFNKHLPRIEKIHNFKINRTSIWFSFGLFFVNPKIYSQISKNNPDIIHTIGIRSFQSFIAAIISKKKNIPLIISDQGGLSTHPSLKNEPLLKRLLYKLQTPMIKYIANQASKVIVANEYEKEIFSEFVDKSRIGIVRNGINLEILDSKETDFMKKHGIKEPFILFLGRFTKIKGIDVLLHAIKIVKKERVSLKTKFVIMGVDFGFQNEMFDMINKLKIANEVIVIKNPSRDDVITAYKKSKFLVLPSRWELSPLTPLEGFAFKKPVISTNVHGIPYTISNGKNGILVEPDDPLSLSNAILELYDNEEKCRKFGISGYDLVQSECNSVRMTEQTLEIYKKVIK
tara:strand:+ start:179 stop:1360 length:1182 start_codon:yes stop_codon:yes gene_type:complete